MNYTNEIYTQNTYSTHFQIDHISQQQNLIEAIDALTVSYSDEAADEPNEGHDIQ